MSNTPGRSLAAVFAVTVMVTAGCGDAGDGAPPAPASTTASTTPSVTSTVSTEPLTLAVLAEHPCRALDEKQLNDVLALPGQSQEGGEQETGFRQCDWRTARGELLFGAHPDADLTADPRVAQLEPGELDGHRTMLGVDSARDRCMMYVAVGAQQSFQVAIHPHEGLNLGMAGCDIVKQVATNVLANLS